jgi:hypothetical protein
MCSSFCVLQENYSTKIYRRKLLLFLLPFLFVATQKADCRQRAQGRLCRHEDPFNAGNQAEKVPAIVTTKWIE